MIKGTCGICSYIYVDANPTRAAEIFKYKSVIHDASLRYNWDAVLLYDFHFHHLMAEDPSRSWASTDPELCTQIFIYRPGFWPMGECPGARQRARWTDPATSITRAVVPGGSAILPTNAQNVPALATQL